MAKERITITMEQRENGDGAVIIIPPEVMRFCVTHVGFLSITPKNGGEVILQDGGQERRLTWAEISTGDDTPQPGLNFSR